MSKAFPRICTLVPILGLLLGIYEGRLALWTSDTVRPYQIFDIREDSLPPADRLQLRQGIPLTSREELWEILENFMD